MRIMTGSRAMPRMMATVLATVLLALSTTLWAQTPAMNIKRIHVSWPEVEVFYEVDCGAGPGLGFTPGIARLTDNGWDVGTYAHSCPDAAAPCRMSVALVLDASGSMSGTGNTELKRAAHAFVDSLDGTADEAAILFYNSSVTVQQQMTSSKLQLHSAIDLLPASGGTATWDGAYAGVQEAINSGVNGCRAVIVVTDGTDNSSTRLPSEIIALAAEEHIRVFTLALGTSIDPVPLQQLAQQTGGRYTQTAGATALTGILSGYYSVIRRGFEECMITYQPGCPDGALHEVVLTVDNVCSGPLTDTLRYRAPRDTTMFLDMNFELTDHQLRGGELVTAALRLASPLNNARFEPFSFKLEWDQTILDLKSSGTPSTSLWSNLPMLVTAVPGGLFVEVRGPGLISGPGMLMELTFQAPAVPLDTVCTFVRMTNASFSAGCYTPRSDSGRICVLPGAPDLSCSLTAPPALTWNRSVQDYLENPFPAMFRLENTGDGHAANVRFRIDYDTAAVALVTPSTDTLAANPADLAAGRETSVTWSLRAKPRETGDTTHFAITASADNAPDVTCTARVFIPPADPILQCTVDAPQIMVDASGHRYVPMPFPVTVSVVNTFGGLTDSLTARIVLPPDLMLAGPDAPDRTVKSVLPRRLFSRQTGTTQWLVQHPVTTTERRYTVSVWVRNGTVDSTLCEVIVTVPAMDAPILAPRCFVPDSLTFDESADQYIPNPFPARLTCVNTGNMDAHDVRATIVLPPDCELDPPSQPLTKTFTPSTLTTWKIGDPVPELSWSVRWTGRHRYYARVPIRFAVSGKRPDGAALDTAYASCDLAVRGLPPVFTCELEVPDSLGVNAAGTDVEPNPFTITYTVRNTGLQEGRIARLVLELPWHDGYQLQPMSPNPVSQDMNLVIGRGGSSTWEWIVGVANRTVRRTLPVRVTALDDEGNPIACEEIVPVAAVETKLEADLLVQPDTLRCIADSPYVHATHFTVTAVLKNNSSVNLNNVLAALQWSAPGGSSIVEFDPQWPDNSNPRTRGVLFPSENLYVVWGLRLREGALTTQQQRVDFQLRCEAGNAPAFTTDASLMAGSLPPRASVRTLGPTSFCEGDSVVLDAGMSWASWAWNTGDSTRFITVRTAGSYHAVVTAFDRDGCPARTDTVDVTVHPLPPKPAITRNLNTLTADSADAWQWFRNGAEIPGAAARTYTVQTDGYYQVRVSSAQGCSRLSDSLFVAVTSAGGAPAVAEIFDVYPNPSSGVVTVRLGVRNGPVEIVVTDLLGRDLLRRSAGAREGESVLRIDLSEQRPGVYFIHADNRGRRRTAMVVIRRE